jgi:hypothetical protein
MDKAVNHIPTPAEVRTMMIIKTGIIKAQIVGLTPNQIINPTRIKNDIPKSINFPNTGEMGMTILGKYTLVNKFFEVIKLPLALVKDEEKNVHGTRAV